MLGIDPFRFTFAGLACHDILPPDISAFFHVDIMTRGQIEEIRDKHSVSYKSGGKSPWKTDFDMMAMKTAAKRFLKPYAAESEGLALMYSESETTEEPQDPEQEEAGQETIDNVIERTSKRLDDIAGDFQAVDDEEGAIF